MDKRDIRRIATKKFMENFDEQFSESLLEAQTEEASHEPQKACLGEDKCQDDEQFNLSDLEEAIADIDEYMKTHKKQPPSSSSPESNL